jgi:hypothetical protein
MTSSAVFEVALGLMLVYLLFSVAVSRINELVVSKLELRADGLEAGLRRLFEGGPEARAAREEANAPPPTPSDERLTVDALTDHELIKNESAPGKRPAKPGKRPSYVRPRAFALAVLDLLAPPLHVLVAEMTTVAAGNTDLLDILTGPGDEALRVRNLAATLEPAGGGPPGFVVKEEVLAKLTTLLHQAQIEATKDTLGQVHASIENLSDGHPAKRALSRFVDVAGNDRDKLLAELERWYGGVMDRVSGWYKRKVQRFVLGYAIALTIICNVDSLAIANTLYRDSGTRQVVAAAAAAPATGQTADNAGAALESVKSSGVPLGWVLTKEPSGQTGATDARRHLPRHPAQVLLKLLGLAVTVGALSFGAPFWFDVLGKMANVRNAGQKPVTAAGPTP